MLRCILFLLAVAATLAVVPPSEWLSLLAVLPLGLGIVVKLGDGDATFDNLKQLRERAGELAESIKKRGAEFNERKQKRDGGEDCEIWPDNTRAEWTQVNDDYNALLRAIDDEQQAADVAARAAAADEFGRRMASGGFDPDRNSPSDPSGVTYGDLGLTDRDAVRRFAREQRDRTMAFQMWALRGVPGVRFNDDHHAACERIGFDPASQTINLRLLNTQSIQTVQSRLRRTHHDQRADVLAELAESRALSQFTGGDGGFLIAPGMLVNSLELTMIEYGAILQVADTITTATGHKMGWPVGDDTSNEGAYADENVDAQNDGEPNPSFEQVQWDAYTIHSKFIKVPYGLMRDSMFNIDTVIGTMGGERLGRKLSSECTTGQNRIRGIVPRSELGRTAASATAISRTDLVKLQHSIDPAIRPGSRFMWHDTILEAVRLLVDGQNLPIYQSNARLGVADTVEGWNFVINQKMDSTMASTKKTVLGGRLENYKVRRVGPSLRVKRLEERFAENDQTAFIFYIDVDGNLLRPQQAAACPVKYIQH